MGVKFQKERQRTSWHLLEADFALPLITSSHFVTFHGK